MKSKEWLVALVVFLSASHAPYTQSAVETIQIRPGVYVIFGAGSNVVMQVGEDGVILVDSGSAAMADQVLAEVRKITADPIRLIINTSADPDHLGANERIAREGVNLNPNAFNAGDRAAGVLAHENVLNRVSAPTGQEAPFPVGIWPTETYISRTKSMYLNDEGIQVIHQPAAHSDGDSIVFFRRADVIATGDILDLRRFPVIDPAVGGSIQGELDALNGLLELAIPAMPLIYREGRTYLVPGHGRIADHAEVVEYRDMVTVIRDRIKSMMDRGMTLEQIKAANPTQGYRARYGSDAGPWTTDMFVEAVFKGLTPSANPDVACRVRVIAIAFLAALVVHVATSAWIHAQGRGAAPAAPPTPRAAAPIDLTGYWVAYVTEDWRWRMVTPAKGDYASIPLTVAGKKLADAWDPARDEAAGERCKSYGAPGLMRAPTRLRVTWLDDATLKLETDYGMQTRLLQFRPGTPPAGAPTLQGVTTAQWVAAGGGRGRAGAPRRGSLKSITTRLRPGYLRKNGVPYSANTVFTEYWDVLTGPPDNTQWLVVTNVVEDPVNLQTPWITSVHFKKEPDGTKWDPTPCSARF